jgi:hypothetical protein
MPLRRASSPLLVALFLGALLVPNLSHADPSDADKAQARELVGEGLKALRASDFEGAFRAFSGADKLYHAPTTLLGLARAHVGLRHLVAAQEAYNKLIREPLAPNAPEIFVKAVEDANKELAALTPRIPFVLIQVKASREPEVTIDGEKISSGAIGFKRQVDPGKHVIKASAPGYLPATAEVTTVENNTTPVPVTLTLTPGGPPAVASGAPATSAPLAASGAPAASTPLPPPELPPDSSRRTYAYIGWGVGGAGLVLGAITGLLAVGKKSDLDAVCQGGHCPPDSSSTHDSYKTMGLLSTIGFATMVVGGGVGTVLFFTAPTTPQTGVSVRPSVGLGSVGFQGAFLWCPLAFSRVSCCSRPAACSGRPAAPACSATIIPLIWRPARPARARPARAARARAARARAARECPDRDRAARAARAARRARAAPGATAATRARGAAARPATVGPAAAARRATAAREATRAAARRATRAWAAAATRAAAREATRAAAARARGATVAGAACR